MPVRPHRCVTRVLTGRSQSTGRASYAGSRQRCEAQGPTLWSHWREQPCPGALCPLQPRPATALHSAACSGVSHGWAHDMWPLPWHVSRAPPVAVRAVSLSSRMFRCVHAAFAVSVHPAWPRGHVVAWPCVIAPGHILGHLAGHRARWRNGAAACCACGVGSSPPWPHGGALLNWPVARGARAEVQLSQPFPRPHASVAIARSSGLGPR